MLHVAKSQRRQHGPAEWGMARVQPNGTQIAPNCSKPGLEKSKWDVRHAMWCTVNIWSKLMKGQSLPRSLFLDIHRGETVPSLALKWNFLLQTTAPWPVCFPAPTYHVLSSKHIPTVQVHRVSNEMLFSFQAIIQTDLTINPSQFLNFHLSVSNIWQQKHRQTSEWGGGESDLWETAVMTNTRVEMSLSPTAFSSVFYVEITTRRTFLLSTVNNREASH